MDKVLESLVEEELPSFEDTTEATKRRLEGHEAGMGVDAELIEGHARGHSGGVVSVGEEEVG